METTDKKVKLKTQRPESLEFINLYNQLKGVAFQNNAILSVQLGFKTDSSITEIVKGRQNISTDKLQKFKEIYRSYIDTDNYGNGVLNEPEAMYNRAIKQQTQKFFYSELSGDGDETPFRDLGNGQLNMFVPLIQERAYASYMRGFADPEYLADLPKHSLVVSKQHRGRYVAIIVEGDSMTDGSIDSIPEGSIATGREIQKHLWTSRFHIHRFKDYIIHHKEGIIIKRIIKHDVEAGLITCASLNPDKENYPDFNLNLDDCVEIFNIVNVSLNR